VKRRSFGELDRKSAPSAKDTKDGASSSTLGAEPNEGKSKANPRWRHKASATSGILVDALIKERFLASLGRTVQPGEGLMGSEDGVGSGAEAKLGRGQG
jgi:hypothetical protein